MVEPVMKPVPLTVSVKASAPALTLDGLIPVIVGAGGSGTLEIVNVCAFEGPPPGGGLKTVRGAVPTAARSLAGMLAVTRVAETNVVVRSAPLKRTTELVVKFVPLTVSVKAALPTMADVGLILVVVGAGGITTGTVTVRDA